MVNPRNVGAAITPKLCKAAVTATARVSALAAATGAIIDRLGFQSAQVVVGWSAAMTKDETLNLAVQIEHGDDNGLSGATTVTLRANALLQTATSSTTFTGEEVYDIDMSGYGRYVRVSFTGTLSKSGTDTLTATSIINLGGGKEPASN